MQPSKSNCQLRRCDRLEPSLISLEHYCLENSVLLSVPSVQSGMEYTYHLAHRMDEMTENNSNCQVPNRCKYFLTTFLGRGAAQLRRKGTEHQGTNSLGVVLFLSEEKGLQRAFRARGRGKTTTPVRPHARHLGLPSKPEPPGEEGGACARRGTLLVSAEAGCLRRLGHQVETHVRVWGG